MDSEEVATSTGGVEDCVLDGVARSMLGCDGGSNDGCARASELGGDKGETFKVFGALFGCGGEG